MIADYSVGLNLPFSEVIERATVDDMNYYFAARNLEAKDIERERQKERRRQAARRGVRR